MRITVLRYFDDGDTSLSLVYINGKFFCDGLEDEERTVKVFGETRIPDGTYTIKYRTTGGHFERYRNSKNATIKQLHNKPGRGMLHILDVPNFKYILIHIGNTDDDTAGCLLVGSDRSLTPPMITNSTGAYIRFYDKVASAIDRGETVKITFKKL